MCMDLAAGGELSKLIDREKLRNESMTRFYMAELTLALEYLHSNHIIHMDLKPESKKSN